ncbi:MAG: alkaline phosphatase family protein [Candidatus Thorarchaeota archaeon]
MMSTKNKKLILIGLDCATPKTLFKDFIDDCPNIKKLLENGVFGILRSTDPPITIPAWMSMLTGKDPGFLGVYGFRHRRNYSYTDFYLANSNFIKEPKIWDILAEKDLKSCIVGVPPSYPVKPVNGYLISGFMAPSTSSEYTYPPILKQEIKENIGDYILDIQFRIGNKEKILMDLYEMTEIQFKTVKYLMKNKEWDFFLFVIIGLDRMHHAFWKYYDKQHQKYEPNNIFESEMRKYYNYLDKKIGELIELLDNNTSISIVSDHGVKPMKGCISINLALESLGLLKFKGKVEPGTRFEDSNIDWSQTYAWGWGGYEARIFLNVKGRESNGIINKDDYEEMREKIAEKIKTIKDDKGTSMNTKVYKPEELYPVIRGDPPDLIVYFDDLNWRSVGTVGYKTMYLMDNDTGPDDAVHDYHGVYIFYNPKNKKGRNLGAKNILDIAPTILNLFGIGNVNNMKGEIIKF